MTQLVFLDTELTGIGPEHRMVSLGLYRPREDLGKLWYFNPGKESTEQALAIHGLTSAFLAGQPDFADQAQEILDFIGGATLMHHCWLWQGTGLESTDEHMLNMELGRAGLPAIPHDRWVNLKSVAKALSPDRNSLSDMFARYNIDPAARGEKHDALTDARLTARVYDHYMKDKAARPAVDRLMTQASLG